MKGLKKEQRRLKKHVARKAVLPAVLAAGGLAGAPANGLELGQVQVESTLGQPLRASIAFALNPNEQLYDFCIFLRPGNPGELIPSVSRARVRVSGNRIILTGNTPVRDPLLNLQVAVDCPYTPHLIRQYTMIIDPARTIERNIMLASQPPIENVSAPNPVAATRPGEPAASVAPPTPRREAAAMPVTMQTEYRVQRGDSLSTIAARVEGRTTSLRTAIDAIASANPDAFIGGDINRLMAGTVLTIPALDSRYDVQQSVVDAPVDALEESAAVSAPATTSAADLSLAPTAAPTADATPASNTIVESSAAIPERPVSGAEPESALETPVETATPSGSGDAADESPVITEDLRPGDVIIPATPATQTVAPVVQAPARDSGSNWLVWLGAAFAAMLLSLLFLFRDRVFGRLGSRPVNAPAPEAPEIADDDATAANPAIDDVDYAFEDAVNASSVELDADLVDGSGLTGADEIEVSGAFGFDADGASSQTVDLEIPEEATVEPESPDTDIIPPSHRIDESSILEAEVAPEFNDVDVSRIEEYDLSMIVDATKQNLDNPELTARDLQAVKVEDSDQYSINNQTLTNIADIAALEQDYEDEFSQTQALNKEIEDAARELAKSLDEEEGDTASLESDPGLEPTAEMPTRSTLTGDTVEQAEIQSAEVSAADTAEMPTQVAPVDDETAELTAEMPTPESEADEAELTAELTANLEVETDAINDDVISEDEDTASLAAGSDVTVEMQVESGKVDTSKKT